MMLQRTRRRPLVLAGAVIAFVLLATLLHGVGYLRLLRDLGLDERSLRLENEDENQKKPWVEANAASAKQRAAAGPPFSETSISTAKTADNGNALQQQQRDYLDVLPATVRTMSVYYRSNLLPSSLDALLPPAVYSAMQCPALQLREADEYTTVVSRVSFRRPPLFKMPWYYHDPHPLCGRYLLRHLLTLEEAAGRAGQAADYAAAEAVAGAEHVGSASAFHAGTQRASQSLYLYAVRSRQEGSPQTPPSDAAASIVRAVAGVESRDVFLDQCGTCRSAGDDGCSGADVLVMARLMGESTVLSASVVPRPDGLHDIRFTAHEPGEYILEVKLVHFRGSSNNASLPRSLGVIGIRASDHNRKSFKYNLACDVQRNAMGSPVKVLVVAPDADNNDIKKDSQKNRLGGGAKQQNVVPFCSVEHARNLSTSAGRWVRFATANNNPAGAEMEAAALAVCPPNVSDVAGSPYCSGNPTWLSDACGFNDRLLWAPERCKFRFFSPPHGPPTSCLRRRRRGFLLLVGDSVTREYAMNCNLFDLRPANLVCLFNNIALEGQHYSYSYAKDVSQVIINSLKTNKAAVFATNLGIHHMIGPCSTDMWIEFVDIFVETWKREKIEILAEGRDDWLLEKAVWIGPPAIHYARKGMGFQRGQLWDAIAWARLEPLGFRRLHAIGPTLPRVESTWDGLHYASQRGKVQSPWRNRQAPVLTWNGGVANMLFTMLLNIICY
jgi:hypothetical protein